MRMQTATQAPVAAIKESSDHRPNFRMLPDRASVEEQGAATGDACEPPRARAGRQSITDVNRGGETGAPPRKSLPRRILSAESNHLRSEVDKFL